MSPRFPAPVFAISALLATTTVAGQATRQEAVFPSEVELVYVDAVVLDKQGEPVAGLTADDFTVKEDGRIQKVTSFETLTFSEPRYGLQNRQRVSTNEGPRIPSSNSFVVVFDDANLSQYSGPRARDAVIGFLQRALRPGDQVTIVPTAGGAWWTGQVPQDREALVEFASRLEGKRQVDTSPARIWDYESMIIAYDRDPQILGQVARRYFENNVLAEAYPTDAELSRDLEVSPGLPMIRARARAVYGEATQRLRLTLKVLDRVAASLGELKGRKTLFLVSDGFIMDPTQEEFQDLVRTARNTNTVVHFVDATGPMGALGQPGMPGGDADIGRAVETRDTTTVLGLARLEQQGARSVAADTGGSVVSGSRLVDEMARVVAESRAYYLLGYVSGNTRRDGKFRKIEVALDRPGLTVRARSGYYAPSSDKKNERGKGDLDPEVRSALDAPYSTDGIPLRLTSFVLAPGDDGKVESLLIAEADVRPLRLKPKQGRYDVALDSYVVVYGRESGEVASKETLVEAAIPADRFPAVERSGLPIRREFALAPGHYQARLLLRDRASGALGSVLHDFDVPAADTLRLTTPILTNSIQPGGEGTPPRPVPLAHRTFPPGSKVLCAFQVLGAARDSAGGGPRVTVAYRLLDSNGDEVASQPPQVVSTDAAGRPAGILLVLQIPQEQTGEMSLEITVNDHVASTELKDTEPFEVSPG